MELDDKAGRKANALTWVGLGLMSVQFGVLARLTWWEYSWDVSRFSMLLIRQFIGFYNFLNTDYGTGDIFCHIRNSHGGICVFRADETSKAHFHQYYD